MGPYIGKEVLPPPPTGLAQVLVDELEQAVRYGAITRQKADHLLQEHMQQAMFSPPDKVPLTATELFKLQEQALAEVRAAMAASQLNSLSVTPLGGQVPGAKNWFEQNGINPLWLVAIALRLGVGKFQPNQGFVADAYKDLFPFNDIHVAITDKKVFFTYYYGEDCVTIPDSPVEQFPTPEFLAVLRVAMDGLK